MPAKINDKTIFSLLEVTNSIKKTLAERYKASYWITAEMNKLNYYSQSGHCFPELVEKRDGKIIAQIKSTLWAADYVNINRNFLDTLNEPLKDGIKILFLAKIAFDPSFGLSLQIIDIDPQYTLGDLEKEKRETVKKLQLEGVFDQNKKIPLPLLPQRIAIISVASSKGYGDFIDVIDTNAWGYHFFHFLFPAMLQGDKAVDSIIGQLDRIRRVAGHFDVVVLIRGGGGDVGLSCYNNYRLAREIALFPIPVLTGIGHVTNETVCEMISHTNAITPSKLAEFLIQNFHNFAVPVQKAKELVVAQSRRLLNDAKTLLQSEIKLFRFLTENILNSHQHTIKNARYALEQHARFILKNNTDRLHPFIEKTVIASTFQLNQFRLALTQYQDKAVVQSTLQLKGSLLAMEQLEKTIHHLDPATILKRGFSITYFNGKAIKDVAQLAEGEKIQTVLYDGTIDSTITKIKK
jgi:exodeoxyribonuclease VII large subunit